MHPFLLQCAPVAELSAFMHVGAGKALCAIRSQRCTKATGCMQADRFPLHPRLVHAGLHWAQALLACGALQAPSAAAVLEARLGLPLEGRLGPWKHAGELQAAAGSCMHA